MCIAAAQVIAMNKFLSIWYDCHLIVESDAIKYMLTWQKDFEYKKEK